MTEESLTIVIHLLYRAVISGAEMLKGGKVRIKLSIAVTFYIVIINACASFTFSQFYLCYRKYYCKSGIHA